MTRREIIVGMRNLFSEVGHDIFEGDEIMTGRDVQDIICDLWVGRSDENNAAFHSIVGGHDDESKGYDEWREIKNEAFPPSYNYSR